MPFEALPRPRENHDRKAITPRRIRGGTAFFSATPRKVESAGLAFRGRSRHSRPMLDSLDGAAPSLFVRDSAPTGSSPNSSAPVVVLLPPFPFDSRIFESAFLTLSARYRVLCPETRGLGKSTLGRFPHFFEALVDDLASVLESRGVERATFVGVSMGGYLALRFSERFPEKVRGLVLAATHASADTDAQRLGRSAAAQSIASHGLEAYAKSFLGNALAPDAAERNPSLERILATQIETQTPAGVIANLLALATRTSTEAHLPHVTTPVLLLAGERDSIVPREKMEGMAKVLRQAVLKVLPGTGHLGNVEAPELFEELVESFLRDLD